MSCPWKANVFTIILEKKKPKPLKKKITHTIIDESSKPLEENNQKASKTTHTHQAWVHTHRTPQVLIWFLEVHLENKY